MRKVLPNTHRYLPVQLLLYGDATRGELGLGVCIDELQPDLGLALDKVNAIERLGLSIAAPAERPIVDDDEVEQLRVSREQIAVIEAEGEGDEALTGVSVDSLEVRSISVFEHPALVSEALDSARQRLLIISPWVAMPS